MLAFLKKDKGLFSYILVLISDRLIGLCLIYFLVRSISDEYFAYWTQVNFLPGALCGILGLGLGRGVLRLLVDNEYSKKLVRNILMTICIIFIFVSLSSYLIILLLNDPAINTFMGGITYPYRGSIFLMLFIMLEGIFEIFINYLRAKFSDRFVYYMALRILPRIIIGLLIVVLQLDFWLSFTIYFVLSASILLFLFFTVMSTIDEKHENALFNFEEYVSLLKKFLKYSVPLMLAALALPILNIIIRGQLFQEDGYSQLGVLSIYMSFIGILVYFPEAFQTYIFPRLVQSSKKGKEGKKEINYQLGVSIGFSLFICIVFSLIGFYLLDIIYPKNEWVLIDSIFIAVTSFLWILFSSFQKFFLVYFAIKTQILTLISFLSLALGSLVVYSNFLSGPLNSILGLISYFFLSSILLISLFIFFKNNNNAPHSNL